VTEEHPDAEAVRRLLAQARHTEPMPDDVAARMDAVLDDLAHTPAGSDVPAAPAEGAPRVLSLAGHRRRRAAGLLVAAAAIVVGGVTVAQHLPSTGGSSGPSAASGEDSSTEFDRARDPTSAPQSSGRVPAPQDFAGGAATVRRGRVVIRPQHFTADALAARRLVAAATTPDDTLNLSRLSAGCIHAPADSTVVRASYQRAPAALVFHRPASSSQVVDLYVCGSRRPVRSATLPQP
jgi:hypothetical protein